MHLVSGGGNITIDALDGAASVQSAGGEVRVHCGERLGRVRLDSGVGDVSITLTPALRCRLVVQARDVVLEDDVQVDGGKGAMGKEGGQRVWDVGPIVEAQHAPAAVLEVVSGGCVRVGMQEAWFANTLRALRRD